MLERMSTDLLQDSKIANSMLSITCTRDTTVILHLSAPCKGRACTCPGKVNYLLAHVHA